MTVNRYYRQEWVPEGVDPDILEKIMGSRLEPDAKNALDRILAKAPDLTAEEGAAILIFLEFQRIRVPRQAMAAKELLKNATLIHSPALGKAVIDGKVTINDSFRFDFMRMAFGKFHPYFLRMHWEVVECEEDCAFIISDSPVTFYNVDFIPPAEAGIALAGTTVFYPLSSKQLLVLRHPEYMEGMDINPSSKIPEPVADDRKFGVTFGAIWEAERVNKINWVLMELADRYIAAFSKRVLDNCVGRELAVR